jgi:MATE family multidrug resistance protein
MSVRNPSWAREARALAGISAAVTLTMFAQLMISGVETLIVARLGEQKLAGVTLAISVETFVFLFCLGIVTAVTPIAADARGRGDRHGLRITGQQGLWVALGVSMPGMLVLLAAWRVLAGMGGAEADSAAAYLSGAIWGLPAWLAYIAVRCLAVATGRVRVTTTIMLASVPIHAVLAWVLVRWLGVAGAGIAYSLTAYGALGLLAVILRPAPADDFAAVFRRPYALDLARARAIVALGTPFAFRIVLREGVLPVAALLLAPFGAAALAAHAVAAGVISLAGVFSFGFSDAANMRVSSAAGAGTGDGARRAAWVAVLMASAVSAVVAATIAVTARPIAGWVLGDADPSAAAALLSVAAWLLFAEGVQSAAGGALSGLRDARGPLLMSVAGFWLLGLPLGLGLARLTARPEAGLWWGLVVGAGVTTALYLYRLHCKFAALH